MFIGFIEPTLRVFEDNYVTSDEVLWYSQELTSVIISSMVVTLFMAFAVALVTEAVKS